MRGFFFFLISLLSISPELLAKETYLVKEESIAPSLPARRPQYATSYCYAFAATALIEQFYCAKKNGCAADGSERFSPLDALAITNYGQGTFSAITSPGKAMAVGYHFEVLEKVNRKVAIFKESCAPFDAAVTAGAKKSGVELQPPWQALRWIFEEYQKRAR